MLTRLICSFVLISLLSAVSGLYFHIGETEKKCFIEEIPDETMVVGKYPPINTRHLDTSVHGVESVRASCKLSTLNTVG